MPHTRTDESHIRRQARRVARDYVMRNSYRDQKRAENICVVYETEIEQHVWEQIEANWKSDFVRGEILVDSRGEGSLQK